MLKQLRDQADLCSWKKDMLIVITSYQKGLWPQIRFSSVT